MRTAVSLIAYFLCISGLQAEVELRDGAFHVHPGDRIQDAVDLAGRNRVVKTVKVHAGVYRPEEERQAMIWLNRRHEGVRLEAVGEVILTAANPEIADKEAASYPAVVNHVIYFGDGISNETVLDGFKITGANAFMTERHTRRIEPDNTIVKNWFFFSDGGAIKIFGRSYPTIQNVEVYDNFTSPCGAGVSVQHEGFNSDWVIMRNCVFRNNSAQVTGCAVDLLAGSAAKMINCLFVGNQSNTGVDVVAVKSGGDKAFSNSGVLTIFEGSRAVVERCTFTGNRNAIDDMWNESIYRDSIFWKNDISHGAFPETSRYELDLQQGAKEIEGCFIGGVLLDPKGSVSGERNVLKSIDPEFNLETYVPQNPSFKDVGYRPIN